MNDTVKKIKQCAEIYGEHAASVGIFEMLLQIREWVKHDHKWICFLPSTDIGVHHYGRGFLEITYTPPEFRSVECVMSIASIDDSGVSFYGKPSSEQAVLDLIASWQKQGLPDTKEHLQTSAREFGLYGDWW